MDLEFQLTRVEVSSDLSLTILSAIRSKQIKLTAHVGDSIITSLFASEYPSRHLNKIIGCIE
jgi:hypothetical protein